MNVNTAILDLTAVARSRFSESLTIEDRLAIPDSSSVPKEHNHWLRYDDVTCVYADMVRSTNLSITKTPQIVGKLYELFTGNVVTIFNNLFQADYIDVRGDGAFALFLGAHGLYKAVAAAITIKTFIEHHAKPIAATSGIVTPLASHIGLQRGKLLVKRIGLRGDFQNEVWAGKPVNVASKLASLGAPNQLVTTQEVFESFKTPLLYKSCGCQRQPSGTTTYTGEVKDTWVGPEQVDPTKFGTENIYRLPATWCPTHGDDYCSQIMAL